MVRQELHKLQPADDQPRDAGYALLVLMLVVTVLLIAMTAVIPDFRAQARREQEEELIFRGNQYARAIYLFHNRIGRYPYTVKELLQTNNMRFLRQEFKDPMTRSGRWRLIHISPGGVLTDSKFIAPPGSNPPSPVSDGSAALGSALTNSDSHPVMPQLLQAHFAVPSQFASAQFGFGGQPALYSDSQCNESDARGRNSPTDANEPGQPEESETNHDQAEEPESAASGSSSQSESGSGQPLGGFIAGVASTSRHASMRFWNCKRRYDEWEFVGVFSGAWLLPGMERTMPQGGGAPGAPSPLQAAEPGRSQPIGSTGQQPSSPTVDAP